ncbi:nucleotide-diphospho-sugar transferase [Zopfochytrium polystomum]|nr:nucleotide-diphospho-sugar transferase [Zopfochytrium polystomum]
MLEEAVDFLESRSKANLAWTYEVIVVDDGSTDNTGQVVQQFARERKCPNLRLLTLVKNRGKGGAVSQGMISSRGRTILFADADGATRFSDLNELEAQLSKVSRNGRGVAVGSRAHMVKSEAVVKRSFIRNFLMHSFHTLLFVLGIASIRDTQCGFKMMTRDAASAIVPNMHVEGWIFDIEMLLLALWQDIPIVEVPVSWHEVDGTKMSLARDSIKMAIDLFTIRFNYFVGVWKIRK